MTVQQNITAYNNAMNAVTEHCMALRVDRSAGRVTVIYPDGYYPHGCRVDDSANGLRKAVEVMERHWKESFPSGYGMEG